MKNKSIIFVCHGNICRSPMAEYVMKHLAKTEGYENNLEISSAAVSCEEEGNDIYPNVKQVLTKHGIPFGKHRAHKITPEEAEKADLVLVMDSSNLRLIEKICGRNPKIQKLMNFASYNISTDIEDPWYTRNFEKTFSEISAACTGLLEYLCHASYIANKE